MARLAICRVIAGVLLVLADRQGAVAQGSPPGAPSEGDEADLPDMNSIKAKAEAGKSKAQTWLADAYLATADFTNAVIWYRKAAEQGDVNAQLTLASCLMAGRGTAKNAQEAAQWLRRAAEIIEGGKPASRPATVSVPPPISVSASARPRSIVITKATVAASTGAPSEGQTTPHRAASATNAAAGGTKTILTRVSRADALLAVEPMLQEPPTTLKPPIESR